MTEHPRTVQTLQVFATVGFREKPIRPIPIDDTDRARGSPTGASC